MVLLSRQAFHKEPNLILLYRCEKSYGRLVSAPLLHGTQPPERPATDPGSSASIPREVVQEEMRRQVQEAFGVQQRRMKSYEKKIVAFVGKWRPVEQWA